MTIKSGHTRIVLIFKKSVIKIPRFNLIWKIRKFCLLIYTKELLRTHKIVDNNLLKAILKSIFLGMYSNHLELSYLKKSVDASHLICIKKKFLFFVVQKRVKVLKENDLVFIKFKNFLNVNGIYDSDTFKARNMGIEDDKIKFIDYGNPKLINKLKDVRIIEILKQFSVKKS